MWIIMLILGLCIYAFSDHHTLGFIVMFAIPALLAVVNTLDSVDRNISRRRARRRREAVRRGIGRR